MKDFLVNSYQHYFKISIALNIILRATLSKIMSTTLSHLSNTLKYLNFVLTVDLKCFLVKYSNQ